MSPAAPEGGAGGPVSARAPLSGPAPSSTEAPRVAAARPKRRLAAFRAQCAAVREALARPGAARLEALEWYGFPLGRLVTDDALIAEIVSQGEATPASAHGFDRVYHRDLPVPTEPVSAPSVWRLPELPSRPWHDDSPAIPRLEAGLADVVAEFRAWRSALTAHPDSAELVGAGSWSSLFLSGIGGAPTREALDAFPRTTALIRALDPCLSFGFAFFSRTVAGTSITRHTGAANLRLRHQLCIEVGADTEAHLEVGGEPRGWRYGKCRAFDDSFPHTLEHAKGAPRIVLALDTWHPALSEAERTVLSSEIFRRFGKIG
ncbi:MAG: aspartyl/asparaginyl beta-hydroxylase domain-containing protein [Alphaproteobacteria bacterium]